MKTREDEIKEKISDLKTKEVFLPERCKSHEDILFEIVNEIAVIKTKLEKIYKVLGE